MNWVENLLIIGGISLDIFAGMECQGSLVAKIDKKQLGWVCALIAAWQLTSLYVGNVFSRLLYGDSITKREETIGIVIATVIFFCLGIRLMIKAVRNERIYEHREDHISFRRFLSMVAGTSLYTLLAGIAFGFLGTDLAIMLVMIACLTIAVVVTGMYTGYHFGFEHKTKAYICGAVLLWVAGFDVIFRHMLHWL